MLEIKLESSGYTIRMPEDRAHYWVPFTTLKWQRSISVKSELMKAESGVLLRTHPYGISLI